MWLITPPTTALFSSKVPFSRLPAANFGKLPREM